MKSARTGSTAPFMVIDTDICERSMPSNSVRMSKIESIATPAMPTSPRTRGWSRVVAAVGGEIEGDREALLAGREVAAVEGVAVLGRREAGVLADRPRLGDVHRRVGAAQERRDAGQRVEEVEAGDVGAGVDRLDRDALGRQPRLASRRDTGRRGRGVSAILVKSGIWVMVVSVVSTRQLAGLPVLRFVRLSIPPSAVTPAFVRMRAGRDGGDPSKPLFTWCRRSLQPSTSTLPPKTPPVAWVPALAGMTVVGRATVQTRIAVTG